MGQGYVKLQDQVVEGESQQQARVVPTLQSQYGRKCSKLGILRNDASEVLKLQIVPFRTSTLANS